MRRVREISTHQASATENDKQETVLNTIFLIVTAFVAYHGLTYRDEEGETDFVHMLFGSIALVFFFRVLLAAVLEVW